jgi:hypothetical protein
MSEEPNIGFISQQLNMEEEYQSKGIMQNASSRTSPESIPSLYNRIA